MMRSIGVIRELDDLGRLVIPMELRRQHQLECGTPIMIYADLDGNVMFLKNYEHIQAAGIIRKIDQLGRLVIPKEIRLQWELEPGTRMMLYADGCGNIMLRKILNECAVCRSTDNLHRHRHIVLCYECMEKLGLNKTTQMEDSLSLVSADPIQHLQSPA